jgi:septum site-determining protein MinC
MQSRKIPRKRPLKSRPASGRPSRLPGRRKRGLVPLVSEGQREACDQERAKTESPPETPPSEGAPSPRARASCLFIDESVRSGQTVEFADGDVTVLGSVGSGAEIVAGGSIHVYGTLRGRALAGVAGDRTARILCQKFEAELVAIDGSYRVAENLDPSLRGRPVQARLEGRGMTLTPLG